MGGTDASGSKVSKGGEDLSSGYEKMQSGIAHRKKERSEKAATGSKPDLNSNNKKMKKSHEKGLDKKANETRARELTSLLKQDLESIKHHEEGDQPRRSDCTASYLWPLKLPRCISHARK